MSKKKTKKLTKTGLDVKTFNDDWSRIKGELEALASEQVAADVQLVEATRALKDAQVAHQKAIGRKTLAEKRLATVRSNLGGK